MYEVVENVKSWMLSSLSIMERRHSSFEAATIEKLHSGKRCDPNKKVCGWQSTVVGESGWCRADSHVCDFPK
jgi:hypothetical protein